MAAIINGSLDECKFCAGFVALAKQMIKIQKVIPFTLIIRYKMKAKLRIQDFANQQHKMILFRRCTLMILMCPDSQVVLKELCLKQ